MQPGVRCCCRLAAAALDGGACKGVGTTDYDRLRFHIEGMMASIQSMNRWAIIISP